MLNLLYEMCRSQCACAGILILAINTWMVQRIKNINILGRFKLQFPLGFVTSCYVIMKISIA